MTEQVVLSKEQEIPFNYEISPKEESLFMATILTQPSHIILKSMEKECEEEHKINVIEIFSLDEKACPVHNRLFLDKKGAVMQNEYITFKVKSGTDEITCFSANNKDILSKLDIYDKINLKGTSLVIKTGNKSIFGKGMMIKDLEYYEDKAEQKTLLNTSQAIQAFMSNIPKLNYPDEVWNAYKHSLMLSMVYIGINNLIVGDAGTFKTSIGYSIKNISGGAFQDIPKGTKIGLLGMAVKDISGKFHLEGGQIFVAKNNVLVLDEVEKFDDYSYLHPLNEVLANHHLTYSKADIKYDNGDFHISLIAMGNPATTNFNKKQSIYKQIENTFSRNKEFLSRMHMMWGLRNVGFDVSALMDTSNNKDKEMESQMAIFIAQAKRIKIKENSIDEDAKAEQKKFAESRYELTKDLRFARKFKEMCMAEAKLNMRDRVMLKDVLAIESIIGVQDKLLWGSI